MAKEKRLFRVLKDGLTIGYSVCMEGDLVVNADDDAGAYNLLQNDGVHPKLGKCIEQVPIDTEPAEGCRMIGNIYGGNPVPKKKEAEGMAVRMPSGEIAEKKSATVKTAPRKTTKKKKTARRR